MRYLLVLLIAGSGCATLFADDPDSLTITSQPSGATYRYGPFTGVTPATLTVPRKTLTESATFTKTGFSDQTVPVILKVQGVTWLDILFWPTFIIDFWTGNAYRLETNAVTVTLQPVSQD